MCAPPNQNNERYVHPLAINVILYNVQFYTVSKEIMKICYKNVNAPPQRVIMYKYIGFSLTMLHSRS